MAYQLATINYLNIAGLGQAMNNTFNYITFLLNQLNNQMHQLINRMQRVETVLFAGGRGRRGNGWMTYHVPRPTNDGGRRKHYGRGNPNGQSHGNRQNKYNGYRQNGYRYRDGYEDRKKKNNGCGYRNGCEDRIAHDSNGHGYRTGYEDRNTYGDRSGYGDRKKKYNPYNNGRNEDKTTQLQLVVFKMKCIYCDSDDVNECGCIY